MEKHDLIASLFQAMNTGDFSDIKNHVTDDVAFDFPGTRHIVGAKKVFIFLEILLRKYKTLTFDVNDILIAP